MSSSTSVALGPTDFNERDTTHFGWFRHAAAKSCSSATTLRTVFVPVTHYLVHAATVHTARQVAHLLYEVTKERRAWPKFEMVDVAIQGLVHSKDKLRHATKSPQVLQNTMCALGGRWANRARAGNGGLQAKSRIHTI